MKTHHMLIKPRCVYLTLIISLVFFLIRTNIPPKLSAALIISILVVAVLTEGLLRFLVGNSPGYFAPLGANSDDIAVSEDAADRIFQDPSVNGDVFGEIELWFDRTSVGTFG